MENTTPRVPAICLAMIQSAATNNSLNWQTTAITCEMANYAHCPVMATISLMAMSYSNRSGRHLYSDFRQGLVALNDFCEAIYMGGRVSTCLSLLRYFQADHRQTMGQFMHYLVNSNLFNWRERVSLAPEINIRELIRSQTSSAPRRNSIFAHPQQPEVPTNNNEPPASRQSHRFGS